MRSSNNMHGFAHQTAYDIPLKLSENPRSNLLRGILSVERDLYSSRDNTRARTEYVSVLASVQIITIYFLNIIKQV